MTLIAAHAPAHGDDQGYTANLVFVNNRNEIIAMETFLA
jgi:hypothetical protein